MGTDKAHLTYEVHWLPGNKWQRFATPARTLIWGNLATIPGTTSIVAPGDTATGSAVWAYGSI
jgi:hypothetical protein